MKCVLVSCIALASASLLENNVTVGDGVGCGKIGTSCLIDQECCSARCSLTHRCAKNLVEQDPVAAPFYCSKYKCKKTCECAASKCKKEMDACYKDTACKKVYECVGNCGCGDMLCLLKCKSSSSKAKAVASCENTKCKKEPMVETMFEDFVQKFERMYTSEEKSLRMKIFKENMAFIEASNAQNKSYTLGVTSHADLTLDEFKAKFVGGFMPMSFENVTKFQQPAGLALPDAVDWTEKGAVSSVKNQGKCGSCWTFSTVGALEGAMKIAGRDLVELSEQMLISCDTGLLGGHGCSGGNPVQAMGWVKSNGICADADYAYECVNGPEDTTCTSASKTCEKTCTPVLKGGGWFKKGDVTAYTTVGQNEGDLEAAVAQQPVSVAIEADTRVFQLYKGGVLTDDACGQNVDHAVLAVGYGTDSGKKYWKVKNSWTAQWGEAGYVRIEKGDTEGKGECAIRTMASFPTVAPKEEIVV